MDAVHPSREPLAATQMNTDRFIDAITAPRLPFNPLPFYESATDSLIVYMRDEKSYAKQVSQRVTLFLAIADDSLVGFELSGQQGDKVK